MMSPRKFFSGMGMLLVVAGTCAPPTVCADERAPAAPRRTTPAPEGYRDFRIGMTRTDAWDLSTHLQAREKSPGLLTVPAFENVDVVTLNFSDGLGLCVSAIGTPRAAWYADATLYAIMVTFSSLPLPVGTYRESFYKEFGKPDAEYPRGRYAAQRENIDEEIASYGGITILLPAHLTDWYHWDWPTADVSVRLDLTARLHGVDPVRVFVPKLTIEQGLRTLSGERARLQREHLDIREATGHAIAGLRGRAPAAAPRTLPRCGTIFGAPVEGEKIVCSIGCELRDARDDPRPEVHSRFAVAWRELGRFVTQLPPTVRLPTDQWAVARGHPKQKEIFAPAVPRTKAGLLGRVHTGEANHVEWVSQTAHSGARHIEQVCLRKNPKWFLTYLIRMKPDLAILILSDQDVPVSQDDVLALAVGTTTLPRFEIVEMQPGRETPKPHKGLEALAKVSGGRYRIWCAADKPLVTIVEIEESEGADVEPSPAPVPR